MPDGRTPVTAGTKRRPTAADIKAAVNGRDSKLSTLGAIAEALEVPLWMMFIPNMPKDFWGDRLQQEGLSRTVQHLVGGAQADTQMIELQQDVLQARGIVSMAINALFAGNDSKDVECGLRAAYDILDSVFDHLDPVIFWRDAREVSHG